MLLGIDALLCVLIGNLIGRFFVIQARITEEEYQKQLKEQQE